MPQVMTPDSPEELTAHLHEAIPLTAVMGFRALEVSWDAAVLAAPFENNRNHHGTFFGGSLTSLALLTGYAALRCRLQILERRCQIVIRRSTYSYERPARGEARARAEIDPRGWQDLLDSLERRGGGKITLEATVTDSSGRRLGFLTGRYALLPPAGGS